MTRFFSVESGAIETLFAKIAALDPVMCSVGRDEGGIELFFTRPDPPQGRAWRIVWGDGETFPSDRPLMKPATQRRAVAELLLLEWREQAWRLRDRAAFSVVPGDLASSRERAIDRAARLLIANAKKDDVRSPGEAVAVRSGETASAHPGIWALRHRLRRWSDRFDRIVRHEDWRIGVIDQPVEASLTWTDLPPVEWIGAPSRSRYLADPFGWPGRSDQLLCEEFDFGTRKGTLKCLNLEGSRIVHEDALSLPFECHLSFPFLLRHEGRIYCLPESSGAQTLQLFEWQEDSASWQLHATPLEGRAADAILFEQDGIWFIAYTDLAIDPFDNLNLLHAPKLTGPWTPHPGNPVKLDPRSSRPAGGVFRKDSRLFRPAQDCSRTYGGSIRLMEITRCTPDRYAEHEVNRLLPEKGDYPDGLHTLTAFGERSLIDGKRHRMSLGRIAAKIGRRLRV